MIKQASDFRQIFGTLAPHAIVSRTELAILLNTSEGAISQMIYRGELPKTAFPGKRRACWFAADIKQWLDEKLNRKFEQLTTSSIEPASKTAKIGRPRSTIDHLQ